jgi:hypothetical protein
MEMKNMQTLREQTNLYAALEAMHKSDKLASVKFNLNDLALEDKTTLIHAWCADDGQNVVKLFDNIVVRGAQESIDRMQKQQLTPAQFSIAVGTAIQAKWFVARDDISATLSMYLEDVIDSRDNDDFESDDIKEVLNLAVNTYPLTRKQTYMALSAMRARPASNSVISGIRNLCAFRGAVC